MEKDASYSSLSKQSPTENNTVSKESAGNAADTAPQISLPKGGGAIRSIDEKFSVNASNGTSGFSTPFPFSASRNSFMPGLTLGYNSGSGNGTFGLGWNAQPAAIVRKTDHKLPGYKDAIDADIFIFSGAEDLVPVYNKDQSGNWIKDTHITGGVTTTAYRPRIEGGFARIEKITEATGNVYWKVTSGDNVVSVFGKSKSAQIYNPADPREIFKWSLEFSYDDKGNCFRLEYKQEDKVNVPKQVHEKNRLNDVAPFTNAYLKRVKYANKNHFNKSSIDLSGWDNFLNGIDYLLELVLDYGEHDQANPQPADDKGWICRGDPFSDYRAGFEIRTYRLCNRVLMFHHFTELGPQPCLVRSMDMEYDSGEAFTFLKAIIQKGYIRKTDGSYSEKATPPVEFTYQQLGWDTEIKSLPKESLNNLPVGIDDAVYQWIDLYNEGISGILSEQAGNWYYKSNSGEGNFDATKLIASRPSLNGISAGHLHFQDLEARGQNFLVSQDLNGYYELGDDDEWMPFKNFGDVPNVNLQDPNLKLLDLNGDGKADIFISEDEVFVWYASRGKQGFESYQTISKVFDEEKGPNMVFADSTESIVLADMSGDGLMDIVRIRYSEVVYWPNLGYGKFGAKVTMSNAPVFDTQENFNTRYLKLADLDGSGTTGIVYLGHNSFKVYFNQAGNSWSEQNIVSGVNPLPFPKIDEYSSVSVIDLLGNGTACIVWSSSLPQHSANPLYYIDLMGGKKPHVMTSYKNNTGKEVYVNYKPSTFFYLQDKKSGTPWVTKLPFPVQCVSDIETMDLIAKTRFTNQYFYHHGYYDHAEREFRGFGRVDQTDTEDFENYKKHADPGGMQVVDEGFHQPPVLTRTWFHTGAFLDKEKILDQFAHEYYQNKIVPEKQLSDPPLPIGLTTDEWREALRACKGMPLRVEVYTPDGSNKQDIPYTAANHSCLIQLKQPKLQNQYAVFLVQQSEALTYTYERNPSDPRIMHSMTLETDTFGNVLTAAAISYGRISADTNLTAAEQAEQGKTHIVLSQNNVTNVINSPDAYHLPLPYEAMTWELTGHTPGAGQYFSIEEVKAGFDLAVIIPYEAFPTAGKKEKRLIGQNRSLYLKDDLSGPLALGIIESLALPYQSFKLALTPGLRDTIFGSKVSDALLTGEGKYVHFNDGNYWIASSTQAMDAANFYQVTAITDPFGFTARVVYDSTYHLFIQQTTDALGNTSGVEAFNYRTLSPYLVRDINDNRSGVRVDELGMVTASFIMGKAGENKGDFMDTASVEASSNDHPGSTMEYDLLNFINTGKPNFVKSTVQETHYFDSKQTGIPSLTQVNYAYAAGNGGTIMRKKQAEPGLALQENGDGTVTKVDTTPNLRWIGNGRTILNNKGKPVKQYEPYFSTTFEFEDSKELVERGVTPVITYDSAGRPIRTDLPDGTFIRTEFDAWMQRSFDQNDTVLESQWYADRITAPIPAIATPEEVAAANKAAAHANTPLIGYFDSLGRPFVAIADNGNEGKHKLTNITDINGNLFSITDALGIVVMKFKYDMLGAQLYQLSMDAGEQWIINDAMGKPLRNWDNRGNVFRYECDQLHRPLKIFIQTGTATEINTEKTSYGDSLADAKTNNLRGKVYQHFDAGGVSTTITCDFKGNLLQASHQLCSDYKNNVDWNNTPVLETTVFTSSSSFDALNRKLNSTIPDQSVYIPGYNRTGLLNTVEMKLHGTSQTNFVKAVEYDAKSRRQHIVYGNDTATSYDYDRVTTRLRQMLTTGKNGTDILQKLRYTYDAAGNISFIKDAAQADIFFNNTVVKAENDYTYDALYRLIQATGREHIGQNIINETATNNNFRNFPFVNDATATDTKAMRNYVQKYTYDAVNNMRQLQHIAGTGSYTRTYQYNNNDADRSALGVTTANVKNNQLLATAAGTSTTRYQYDVHGNMLNLPHLQSMEWNSREELKQIDLGGGGIAYYVYDGSGMRTRKVIERLDGSKEHRIYLGGFELYRKLNGAGTIQEEAETLHVMDDTRRIAIVETRTIKESVPSAGQLTRYQFSNHLGSSSLELDENAAVISYEEYHPFGTTAYESVNAAIKAAAKRYRYTGMERDDESGLQYGGARYYIPWLGRWLNPDPSFLKDDCNLYQYAHCNPISFTDRAGTDSRPAVGSILQDMVDIVYNYHHGGGDLRYSTDKKEASYQKALLNFILSYADDPKDTNCKKVDNLTAFDMGMKAVATKVFKSEELLGVFRYAARTGDSDREIEDGNTFGTGPTRGYTFNGGSVLQTTDFYPDLGTKRERKENAEAQASASILTPMLTFNIVNSMGGGAEHTAGEGGGGFHESAHGAPLEPAGPHVIQGSGQGAPSLPPATSKSPLLKAGGGGTGQGGPPSGGKGGGPGEKTVRVERFMNVTDPKSFYSGASTASQEAADAGGRILANPADLANAGEFHALGLLRGESTPFVSLAEDAAALALSPDETDVKNIVYGNPGRPGAPHIATFEIPESLIYKPENSLSQSETEVLFTGKNLKQYLVGPRPNPYLKK